MRICVISTSYPNEDGVGNTFVEQLVNSFVRRGHSCTVISPMIVRFHKRDYLRYKKKETRDIGNGLTVKIFRPRYYLNRLKYKHVHIGRYLAQRCIERTIKRE